jgi:hypothetical protein
MKRIESLDRDITEIQMLQEDINPDRSYSTPLKISLEQQVNNLLNEKTKLMEVRIENAPEYLNAENRKKETIQKSKIPMFSFDDLERDYYEHLRYKRSNYNSDTVKLNENLVSESTLKTKKEPRSLPSLAEKSLIKSGDASLVDQKSFIKSREDLLKNLPPLEY